MFLIPCYTETPFPPIFLFLFYCVVFPSVAFFFAEPERSCLSLLIFYLLGEYDNEQKVVYSTALARGWKVSRLEGRNPKPGIRPIFEFWAVRARAKLRHSSSHHVRQHEKADRITFLFAAARKLRTFLKIKHSHPASRILLPPPFFFFASSGDLFECIGP